jgi:hypothetical protein
MNNLKSLILVFVLLISACVTESEKVEPNAIDAKTLSTVEQLNLVTELLEYQHQFVISRTDDFLNTSSLNKLKNEANLIFFEERNLSDFELHNHEIYTLRELVENRSIPNGKSYLDPFEQALFEAIYESESFIDFAKKLEQIRFSVNGSDVVKNGRTAYSKFERSEMLAVIDGVYTTGSISNDLILRSGVASNGWWESWGRCAAGVAGGALVGGLGGGAAGSVIPGIGTTAGLILGTIGGGLSGAAASC